LHSVLTIEDIVTEPTEPRSEQATPAQWIERLEIFRERFRLRLIDEAKFKDILHFFQFADDHGHLWAPGATSDRWYRWDRTQWTPAAPPAQLTAAEMPITISLAWRRSVSPPPATGASLVSPDGLPSDLPEAHPINPSAPPVDSPRPAPPTDLPERGGTSGHSKPTDLPR
jgi:hypothetical protein